MDEATRNARKHTEPKLPSTSDSSGDGRSPAQHDRDRLIYASALRRLAGVTQVVDAAEGHVFHNRLTHTLKVAQIARRLSEHLNRNFPGQVAQAGGIDPDVVESAALVHDLGHPPFGHLAEVELDRKLRATGHTEGFEGNAQSFRIVTKLAVRSEDHPGLNLTRATLAASLKYPWLRAETGLEHRKFGAYRSEKEDLRWALVGVPEGKPTLEAQVMDRADDIAYAIHDLEDFYRAGLVPLDRLATDANERKRWLKTALKERDRQGESAAFDFERLVEASDKVLPLLPVREPYRGTRTQRANLRTAASTLICRFMASLTLDTEGGSSRLSHSQSSNEEIFLLKELTRYYVICNPSLASQQYGRTVVIRGLFRIFRDAATKQTWRHILPPRWQEIVAEPERREHPARTAADILSALSDAEALLLHRRLRGLSAGSVLDGLPR